MNILKTYEHARIINNSNISLYYKIHEQVQLNINLGKSWVYEINIEYISDRSFKSTLYYKIHEQVQVNINLGKSWVYEINIEYISDKSFKSTLYFSKVKINFIYLFLIKKDLKLYRLF